MSWIEALCLASLLVNVGLGLLVVYLRHAIIEATMLLKLTDELLRGVPKGD